MLADLSATAQTPATISTQVDSFFNENRNTIRREAITTLNLNCEAGLDTTNPENFAGCDTEIKTRLNELIGRRQKEGGTGLYDAEELQLMESTGFLGLINSVQFGTQATVNIAEQEEKTAKLFPQIRQALLEKIESTQIEPRKKQLIKDRLMRVNFGGTDCARTFQGLAKDYLPKAFFEPGSGNFFMCRNLLNTVNSEFALVTIIAHELAHSIDSCNLRYSMPEEFGPTSTTNFQQSEQNFVYSNLTNCLRSSLSVGAKIQYISSTGEMQTPEIDYCDDTDQLRESLPDWFASEVITGIIERNHPNLTQEQWRNGMRNTFRAKCDQSHVDHHDGFDPHPEVRDRYNSNILANRQIRDRMGCGSVPYNKVQCSVDRLPAELTSSGTRNQQGGSSSAPGSGGVQQSRPPVGTGR